jgi:rare lipoprotein A
MYPFAALAAICLAVAGAPQAEAAAWQDSILRGPAYEIYSPITREKPSYQAKEQSKQFTKKSAPKGKTAKSSQPKANVAKAAAPAAKPAAAAAKPAAPSTAMVGPHDRPAGKPAVSPPAAKLPKDDSWKTTSLGAGGGGGQVQTGRASYYWQPQRVASGGWFNPNALTAAHKSLPFGTKVLVTNQHNGRSVTVTINDRGPFVAGRIIDLSSAAAGIIGMKSAGVVPVKVAVLGR